MIDPNGMMHQARSHQDDLLREVENDRIAAVLSSRRERAPGGGLRRDLATACYRLADWLEPSTSVPVAG